jgi:hypothetical protein
MKATQQLKDEHQGIIIVFRILEKICDTQAPKPSGGWSEFQR